MFYNAEQRREFTASSAAECKVPTEQIERDLAFIIRECERMRDAMLREFANEKNRTRATLH